jgi:hypothetical protein
MTEEATALLNGSGARPLSIFLTRGDDSAPRSALFACEDALTAQADGESMAYVEPIERNPLSLAVELDLPHAEEVQDV